MAGLVLAQVYHEQERGVQKEDRLDTCSIQALLLLRCAGSHWLHAASGGGSLTDDAAKRLRGEGENGRAGMRDATWVEPIAHAAPPAALWGSVGSAFYGCSSLLRKRLSCVPTLQLAFLPPPGAFIRRQEDSCGTWASRFPPPSALPLLAGLGEQGDIPEQGAAASGEGGCASHRPQGGPGAQHQQRGHRSPGCRGPGVVLHGRGSPG